MITKPTTLSIIEFVMYGLLKLNHLEVTKSGTMNEQAVAELR